MLKFLTDLGHARRTHVHGATPQGVGLVSDTLRNFFQDRRSQLPKPLLRVVEEHLKQLLQQMWIIFSLQAPQMIQHRVVHGRRFGDVAGMFRRIRVFGLSNPAGSMRVG